MSVRDYDVVFVGGGLAAALLLREMRGHCRGGYSGRGSFAAPHAPGYAAEDGVADVPIPALLR